MNDALIKILVAILKKIVSENDQISFDRKKRQIISVDLPIIVKNANQPFDYYYFQVIQFE